MSSGTPTQKMLVAWCGANQLCNPCPPPAPPGKGPGGGGALPQFELGAINITQVQTVYGTHGDPGTEVLGQMIIQTFKETFDSPIEVAVDGAFGTFLSWPAPYTVMNTYVSTLQITYPLMQNNTYELPTITVGGLSAPADVAVAQQAAVAQAYQVLGFSPL